MKFTHFVEASRLKAHLYEAMDNPVLPHSMTLLHPDVQEEMIRGRAAVNQEVKVQIDAALNGDVEEAGGAILMTDDEYRGYIAVLFYLSDIPVEGYREALEGAWSSNHREVIAAAGGRNRLRAMFRKAQFPLPVDLPEVVRVWRGTSYLPYSQAARGLSWTVDRDVACFFAMRFAESNGCPLVLAADVPRSAILHYAEREEEAVCFDVPNPIVDGTPEDWHAGMERYIEHKREI